jgi:hypothetical protein
MRHPIQTAMAVFMFGVLLAPSAWAQKPYFEGKTLTIVSARNRAASMTAMPG